MKENKKVRKKKKESFSFFPGRFLGRERIFFLLFLDRYRFFLVAFLVLSVFSCFLTFLFSRPSVRYNSWLAERLSLLGAHVIRCSSLLILKHNFPSKRFCPTGLSVCILSYPSAKMLPQLSFSTFLIKSSFLSLTCAHNLIKYDISPIVFLLFEAFFFLFIFLYLTCAHNFFKN